ncbi:MULTISPECIES: sensor histidine kinase [Streptomyces]|uniref:sensor histidine kinase n=1 Tax=Streptomyces TaxID=1883 RepID=UPI0019078A6E|nr:MULTISPECIES: histidine kinase [unclassified Streptomyces]MCU4747514.1 histidine kinase [Streptomyces sp. G-5]QQN78133.1 sensor histidine kinase [Streptomyces sp. XC 2026]
MTPPMYRMDRVTLIAGLPLLADSVLFAVRRAEASPVHLWLTWLLGAAAWALLGLRHRLPVPVGVLTMIAAVAYYPLSSLDGITPLVAFVVAVYTMSRAGHLVAAVTLAVTSMLAMTYGEFVASTSEQRHVDNMSMVLFEGWFLAVIAFGHAMRVRHAYQEESERRAAVAERLRIAREIHDVLGHSISLINVQAGAALHRSAKRPGETAELTRALEFVRDTSKEALRELRGTLGMLRQVDEEAAGAPTSPTPGWERIGDLADRARATGLTVTVRTDREGLPPGGAGAGVSLAAYRIVQEALTNIARHAAGATTVLIEARYEDGALRVSVEDDGKAGNGGNGGPGHGHGSGSGSREPGTGSGIGGMRERCRALGGELTAAHTDSGFRVTARLPLTADRPTALEGQS